MPQILKYFFSSGKLYILATGIFPALRRYNILGRMASPIQYNALNKLAEDLNYFWNMF